MLKRATALAAALALAAPAAADAGFKEPVKVLWQHTGAAGDYFGWAVSALRDVNRDGADDAIVGEPGILPADGGTTWVLSGRTGDVLRRFDGATGDENGFAIADAGDVDRDGYHDIVSGAPRQTGDTEGHAFLYSGRDGSTLHTFAGAAAGDSFGAAVSSAGDVDRDGRPDLLIGAPGQPGGGTAYVFSGRDGRRLFELPPPAAPHAFGTFFLAGLGDVDGDHVPDLAIGSYTNSDGAPAAGKIELFSGRTSERLRTITSTTEGENLGFDAVGIRDVDRDHRTDLIASAAEGDTVYLIAGTGRR